MKCPNIYPHLMEKPRVYIKVLLKVYTSFNVLNGHIQNQTDERGQQHHNLKQSDTHRNPIFVKNSFIILFSSLPFPSHCMGFFGSSLVLLRWCLAVLWGCFAMSTMAMVSSSADVNITPCQVSVSTKMTLATSLCSGRWAAQSTLLVGTALGVSRRRGSTSSWCQHRMEISHGGVTMRTSETSTTSVN